MRLNLKLALDHQLPPFLIFPPKLPVLKTFSRSGALISLLRKPRLDTWIRNLDHVLAKLLF